MVIRMDYQKKLIIAEKTCMEFAKNVAIFTVTRQKLGTGKCINSFWWEISHNALELAILNWCHLFGQRKDHLHWSNVLKSTDSFKEELIAYLEVSENKWEEYWGQLKKYRDKDVAHVEITKYSMIPPLEIALHSAAFYYFKISNELLAIFPSPIPKKDLYEIYEKCLATYAEPARKSFLATNTLAEPT